MIVMHNAILGYVNMIQLTERIALVTKSCKAVSEVRRDMLAFAYSALPARHEVPSKPIGSSSKTEQNKCNSKLKSLTYRRSGTLEQ